MCAVLEDLLGEQAKELQAWTGAVAEQCLRRAHSWSLQGLYVRAWGASTPQVWPWTNPLSLPSWAMRSYRKGVRVGAADQMAWSWIPASHHTTERPQGKLLSLSLPHYLIFPMWLIIKPISLYDVWHLTLGTIIIGSTSNSNSSSSIIILKVALLLILLLLFVISKFPSTTNYLWYMKYLFIYFGKRIWGRPGNKTTALGRGGQAFICYVTFAQTLANSGHECPSVECRLNWQAGTSWICVREQGREGIKGYLWSCQPTDIMMPISLNYKLQKMGNQSPHVHRAL